MGWGITLYPQIYYSKVNFQSKLDVEDKIEDIKKSIRVLEARLLALVMTTEPSKMMPAEENCSPSEWLIDEYRNIIDGDDSLKRYYYELYKLELLRNSWDSAHNKDGLAICPPKETFRDCDSAYLDGDYIESVYEDGDNE